MGGCGLRAISKVFHSLNRTFFFFLFIFISMPSGAMCADVVINEVYYDHPGSDTGYEFIELYNRTGDSVDISGWALEFMNGADGAVRMLWEAGDGVIIKPHGFILVGGEQYVDNGAFPLLRSIENGPDAVRLCSTSGVVDIVGYGDLNDRSLFESSPAVDVSAGFSLSRKPDGADTDDNSRDFVPSSPTPGYMNFHEYDIGLYLEDGIVACRGMFVSVKVFLKNCGIRRFDSGVSIAVRLLNGNGQLCGSTVRVVDVFLEPGGSDSLKVILPGNGGEEGGVWTLYASISSCLDGNPENDSCSTVVSFLPRRVVVNEIMYRPDRRGCEWIELYNRGVESVNVRGWFFSDSGGSRKLITDEALLISPGGYLVLVQDAMSFHRVHSSCPCMVIEPLGGWPVLNDYGCGGFADAVTIYNGERIVDRVTYGDIISDERGRSLERISPDACPMGKIGIWQRCLDGEKSTPGRSNSVVAETFSGSMDVRISPNPFDPSKEKLVITVDCTGGRSGVRIKIFSLDGIEIARLFSDRCDENIYTCFWDGKASDGGFVPYGLYICAVEFLDSGGVVGCVVKRVIVLYRDHGRKPF